MKRLVCILAMAQLASVSPLRAQGPGSAGVLFLMIQPSVRANGMGGIAVTSAPYDALAVAFNPGHVGSLARENRFILELYPTKTGWLPAFGGLEYDSRTLFAGYDLRRLNRKIPMSVGLAYTRVFLDLGRQIRTDESGNVIFTGHSTESATMWSLGVGFDSVIKAGLGLTFKNIKSNLAPVIFQGDLSSGAAKATAHDFGVVAYLPLDEVIRKLANKPSTPGAGLRPSVGPTFGYSRSNVGGEISYIDATQADPLPRVARIGAGLRAGFAYAISDQTWQLVAFEIANEAEQLLVRRGDDGSIRYAGGLGDIDFVDNVVLGKDNPRIVTKRGGEFTILESISIRRGHYKDPLGRVNYETEGIGISLRGLLKAASLFNPDLTNNRTMNFLINHTDLQFNSSDLDIVAGHPLSGTSFSGIRVRVF